MQPARIDETRGCWCDHNGVTYPIPDILYVEDPEHRMDGAWTVKVMIEPVVVMKSKVIWIETANPHHAWDICLALRQARTNLAVERSKGSLWGPVSSVNGDT